MYNIINVIICYYKCIITFSQVLNTNLSWVFYLCIRVKKKKNIPETFRVNFMSLKWYFDKKIIALYILLCYKYSQSFVKVKKFV